MRLPIAGCARSYRRVRRVGTCPADLEQALIRVGHEVEDIINLGPVTGPLTVGRVTAIEELTEFKKPIRACRVDVGDAADRDIVCGATNFVVGDLIVAAFARNHLAGRFPYCVAKDLWPVVGRNDLLRSGIGPGGGPFGNPDPAVRHGVPGADAIAVLGLDDVVSIWRSRRIGDIACPFAVSPAKSPVPTIWSSSIPPISLACRPTASLFR